MALYNVNSGYDFICLQVFPRDNLIEKGIRYNYYSTQITYCVR